MVLPATHLPIRKLVAYLLRSRELFGVLYTCGAIASICNVFMPDGTILTEDLISKSFIGEGDNAWKHIKPIELEVNDDDSFVLSCGKFRFLEEDGSRRRRVVVGSFASEADVPNPDPKMDLTHDVNIARIRRLGITPPPDDLTQDVSEAIQELAKNQKSRTKGKQKKKRKTSEDFIAPSVIDESVLEEPRPLDPPSAIELFEQQSLHLKNLINQQKKLEAEIQTERAKYLTLKREVEAAQDSSLDNNQIESQSNNNVLLTMNGRPGALAITPGDILLYEDIEECLVSQEQVNTKAPVSCKEQRSQVSWWGGRGFWVPNGTTVKSNSYISYLRNLVSPTKKLLRLFKGSYTRFSRRAGRIMTLFFQKATTASGAAKEAIICGALNALVHDIGLSGRISHEQIARACPSENTISNWELDMATCASAKSIHDILREKERRQKPVLLGMMTDHANRKGRGFFAKVLIWCMQKAGEWALQFFCLDIDDCDHTAKGAARGIQKSLDRFGLKLGVDIIINLLTGDAGGGAAVQRLHPALMNIKVMELLSRSTRCLMHALNRAFEMGCLDCFGSQGINHRTMTQMFWLVVQMFQRIKLQGKDYYDQVYALAFEMMINDGKWEAEGQAHFRPAMDAFYAMLDKLFDESTQEGIDAKAEFMSQAPRNITRPSLSRWKSMSATGKLVKMFYPIIYYMAIAVIRCKDSSDYLSLIAKELVSLMVVQPDKKVDPTNADSEEEDFTPSPYRPGDTPPMYALTLWFVAFCEDYFDDMFDWAMRDDPVLGPGSYGQTSRLCPERAFVMHKLLSNLENGGWRSRPAFNEFLQVLEGVQYAGSISAGGREYVEKVPEQFLETYRFFLNRHALTPWTSPLLVIFVLGGNNILSKYCLRRIFNRTGYSVPDIDIELRHHQGSHGPVKINVREAVEFLLEDYMEDDVDSCALFNDDLIQKHLVEWRAFAESADDVDLFDKTTWPEGKDFSYLKEVVMTEIVPMASHQQRIENYIQMAGLVAQTGVDEMRCTWRAILQVAFMRPFNLFTSMYVKAQQSTGQQDQSTANETVAEESSDAVMRDAEATEESEAEAGGSDEEEFNSDDDTEDGESSSADQSDTESDQETSTAEENGKVKPPRKTTRARGRLLMQLLGEQSSTFINECEDACESLGTARVKSIRNGLNTKSNKTSTEQTAAAFEQMRKSAISNRKKPTAAEQKKGIDVPAEIGGAVLLQMIAITHMGSAETANKILRAELEARGIKYSDKKWKATDWRDKKKALKKHELSVLVAEKAKGQDGIKISDVNSVVPQSVELKEFLEQQKSIRRRLETLESKSYT